MKFRIYGAQLLLIVLSGVVLFGCLDHTLRRSRTAELSERLQRDTDLAAAMTAREIRDLRRDAPAAVRVLARALQVRATIVAADGAVVGDSQIPSDKLPLLDNHGTRPEIRAALIKGRGASSRYSETLHTDMLYQAAALRTGPGETAIVRLALPLSELQPAASGLHRLLAGSLSVAVLLVLCNYLAARSVARSLRALADAAARIGKGEIGTRVLLSRGGELGRLAEVLNQTAVSIEWELARTKREKKRLNAILHGMGEGILVVDASGEITLTNPAFRALFALNEEVEGRQLIEISRHPALHDTFRQVIACKAERVEELLLRSRSEKTVLTHWVPLQEQGELQGVVVVFHDITDIRHLENIRKDFVANVSHELRTPITIIKGYAETLLSGPLEGASGPVTRFVSIMHSHAERLAALVADLLTLSQLESGNVSLQMANLNVAEVAERVAMLLENKAREKVISVDSQALREAPAVLADAGRLEQIFMNLLDNAIKYTPSGGAVSMTASLEGNLVRIGVHDTGIGIPSREIPRIFERFYRVDGARSREQGGTGLGLSIVKHIVQMQGGSVSVQSSGQGSSFFFTLKRALL